jgi:hypothetical protein
MDRWKEGYNDCDLEWRKKIQRIIEKHKRAERLAVEQLSSNIIIADSESLNYGRKEAHGLIVYDLEKLLKKG